MSNIPKGYKQTEVGVIPEDWVVKDLGVCFSFSGGHTASRAQLSNDGYCYLHYGDIHGSTKTFIDVCSEFQDIPKLNISLNKVSPKSLLKDGDIVFVDASEDDEGTSKHIVVINKDDIPYISGLHTIVGKSKDDSIDNGYKRFCFQSSNIKSQFKFYSVGTKVSGISKTNISKIKFPLPPTKAEQTAIAGDLSDADALIQSLEKLIAKKRNIKQGAMQELLKPKEGWEVKKLGEIGEIVTGATPPTLVKEYWNGDIPWITPTDISDKKDISNSERELTKLGLKIIRKLPANTLLVTCIASIGKNSILRKKGACNQQINAMIPNDNNNVEFLYYLIENNKQYLLSKAGITATNIISKKEFAEITFSIPPLPEQTRIATILSDMDAEIEALEKKLAKYRQIKQGMMQELLTGKTRLI
jgi:type I restriction enzyme S subunit